MYRGGAGKVMFAKQEVFRESWPPTRLPGRSRELERLSGILKPATRGEAPEHCWEIGPSGVGKTTTAKHLLTRLEQYGVDHAHVECVGESHWELLQAITDEHPRIAPHGSMATEQMLELLATNVDAPFVVILDEFDGLEAPALLGDLYELPNVALLCIGHDHDDVQALVPDAAEGLRHAPVVEFAPYATDALLDILQARADAGLVEGSVTDAQLERIVDRVGGSARYGVQALGTAVELGIERGHTSVQEADVDDCIPAAKAQIREQLLNSLSREHHIVYRVIREADGGLLLREVFAEYEDRSPDPRTRQQVSNYLEKLAQYDIAERVDDGWRAIDDTLKAPLRKERTV